MKNQTKIDSIIEKYSLVGKTIDELQKIIGDSDRGCMNPYESSLLEGDTFIDKAESLYYYILVNN